MKHIFKFINYIQEAKELRNDAYWKENSQKFGWLTILYSILMVPFALLGKYSIIWMNGPAVVLLIFLIGLCAVCAGAVLIFLVHSLICWLIQISLNRNPITWVALLFLIASITVSVLLVATNIMI